MSVLGMLAWFAAAASCWLGARRHESAVARGYRWLAGAALLYCAGLVLAQVQGDTNPTSGLSFADLPSLLALASAAIGITVLIGAERNAETGSSAAGEPDGSAGPGSGPSVLPGLADGYVMAVALLVIGWVTQFSDEFHRSGDRPGLFLIALVHPLADLAVLGALLPMVTTAWRRTILPYLALLAAAVGDALSVGQRVEGGHLGIAAQLMAVIAALLLAGSPWRVTEPGWTRRTANSAVTAVIAAATASVATVVVIASGLAGGPASGVALVVAGGAGVLVLSARVFMLVRENGMVLGIWRESSRNLRNLASRTSDIVLVCEPDGTIRYASRAVAGYGYTPGALVGRRLLDLVHPEDQGAALAAVRHALIEPPAESAAGEAEGQASGDPDRFPARVRAADGTWRHVEASVLRYQAPGSSGQLLVTARDVSDQVALRQQVEHLTFHDGLTGLPNRAYLEERTRDMLADVAAARRTGVIFLDLDRFTAVNDSVGHGAGDLVLAQAARRLRAVVPLHDTVVRWGSDEFAVLIEDAGSVQEVAEIAERLAVAVAAEPFQAGGQQIALTASVGVALAEAGPDSASGVVLRNADVAMSRAKEAGGDRVEI
ncbi:MAG TPA: GGDEF domain-containing protein, partial [Streptosporangiaceae bacterium]